MTDNPQAEPQPETAHALLWRHGLPEDVIDGALCLHAQELVAVQRDALRKTDDPVFYEGEAGWLVDLIDLPRNAAPAAVPSAPASTAPLAAGLPLVQGNCPGCGRSGLFLGSGGYVTCSNADCPEPDAATTVLEGGANWPAVRAAILRELASSIQSGDVPFNTEAAEAALKNGGPFALIAYVQLAIGEHLRRMADEAQQPDAQRCDVEFEGGGTCSKDAGHRTLANQDPHTPAAVSQPDGEA